MKKIFMLALVVLIVYAGAQGVSILKARGKLAEVVADQLDCVGDDSPETVKKKLVDEARALGIDLHPANIQIKYEDTDARTPAQNFVAGFVTFVNKRVEIRLSYNASWAGMIPWPQEIESFKIRQIQAQ